MIRLERGVIRMNLFSRLLHSIPDPSARLFLGLLFMIALMMMGFLLVTRHSHYNRMTHHQFEMIDNHSKT